VARRRPDPAAAARAIEDFLRALGHDPDGERHLRGTGARVAELWIDELLDGEPRDLASIFASPMDAEPGAPLVVLERLATHVVCPHHLTIAQGFASVAYLPGAHVAGLGAIATLVDACAHRLALQEDVGRDVAQALVFHLGARGAACRLELRHGCLELHGPKKRGARVVTLATAGVFDDDPSARALLASALGAPAFAGKRTVVPAEPGTPANPKQKRSPR
jgi:GTP cyclohydrolase I